MSTITVDPAGGPRKVVQQPIVVAYFRYCRGRFRARTFTGSEGIRQTTLPRWHVNAPNTPIWHFTTNDSGESDSNPYDLVFVNSTKAYLLRYGATKAWIVNPSATTQAGFKIGDLDLKAYADADGVPEMAKGVIADGKLFIILQRQDDFFCPSNTAYVAVFDVATDTEIDTGMGEGGMKGIPLSIKESPVHPVYRRE